MLLSVMNPDALDSLVTHKSRMQNVELKECDSVDHVVLSWLELWSTFPYTTFCYLQRRPDDSDIKNASSFTRRKDTWLKTVSEGSKTGIKEKEDSIYTFFFNPAVSWQGKSFMSSSAVMAANYIVLSNLGETFSIFPGLTTWLAIFVTVLLQSLNPSTRSSCFFIKLWTK